MSRSSFRSRWIAGVSAWLLVLVSVADGFGGGCRTTAAETAKGHWSELRSPRFQLWTDGDPAVARRLIVDLERFHQVMIAKTTAEERVAAPPLRIFLGRAGGSFRAWTGADKSIAGLFYATSRGNYALVDGGALVSSSDSPGASRATSLLHEYTHYMMAAKGARVPSWYNEGFAEYMSTTEFKDDGSYTIGCPPLYRTRWQQYLKWLPMRSVMEAENVAELVKASHGSVADSYAQSWYAVHYWIADSTRHDQLSRYLKAWGEGDQTEAALQRDLGLSYAQLDDTLRNYAARPSFECVRIKPASPLAVPEVSVRPLSQSEAHYHVGDLLLASFGPTDAALDLLQRAAALEPDDEKTLVALARAHALKAERATAAADVTAERQQAATYLQRAQALSATDPERLAVEGHLHRARAEQLSGQPGSEAELADELKLARSAYRKAVHLDDALAEAYLGLGLTYLVADDGLEEAQVVLEAAAYLLPLDTRIAWAFARLQLARGHALQAVPALEYVLRWSQNETERADARKAVAELRSAAEAPAESAAPAP